MKCSRYLKRCKPGLIISMMSSKFGKSSAWKDPSGEEFRRMLPRNMGVNEDLIKAINRWNKDPSKGAARLDMIELYSQADSLTPLYL
jgi:hypothetical protein